MARVNNYLLDTHVLLWWLSGDKKLSSKMRRVVSDPNKVIYVSVASVWEMVTTESLGKLKVKQIDKIEEVIKQSGLVVLPVEIEHLLKLRELPMKHKDPFDRLIISQALVEGLVVVTNDKKIAEYEVKILS